MKRWVLLFVLSSFACAGNVVVTLSPLVPSQCAAFVTDVEVTVVTMSGATLPIGKLAAVDLAPFQLSQVPVATRLLRVYQLKKVVVKLANAKCMTTSGTQLSVYSPASAATQSVIRLSAKSTPVVILLNLLNMANNQVRPMVKYLNVGVHFDPPTKGGTVNGLVTGSNHNRIMIFTQ